MGTIPLPALAVRPPAPPPDLLQMAGQMAQLRNLAQLGPLEAQQKQEEIQAQQLQNQQAQINLQNQRGLNQAMTDIYGSSQTSATPSTPRPIPQQASEQSTGSAPTAETGVTSTTQPTSFTPSADRFSQLLQRVQDPKYNISPQMQMQLINGVTEMQQKRATLSKTDQDALKEELDNRADANKQIAELFAPIQTMPPEDQAPAYAMARNAVTRDPVLSKHMDGWNLPAQWPGIQQYQAGMQHLMAQADFLEWMKNPSEITSAEAGAKKAQQEADPVAQLSKPEALAAPGSQQAILAKIQDPTTAKQDIPRLQALLARADAAQQNAILQKKKEALNQQAITQGDPNAAGQLLANRSLTLQELKTRGATPQFVANAVTAAQKVDPNFKAAESEAQSRIAASAANQQFFGNTDSLLIRGGTLDQLQTAYNALGNAKIPAYNTIANWAKAAAGSGPQARFAAAALGVADDYSKVMTGSGTGSDTSRQQALDIVSKNLSPEGIAASVDQIRQQVGSQRDGRIGTNPYMRDMYPTPVNNQSRQNTTSQAVPGVPHDVFVNGKKVGVTTDGGKTMVPVQ